MISIRGTILKVKCKVIRCTVSCQAVVSMKFHVVM